MDLPKVTFADFGPNIASSRLRAVIPQNELARYGIEQGNDVVVYGKHIAAWEVLNRFKTRIYDVCDNHYKNKEVGSYYHEHSARAHLLTVNTPTMQQIVKEHTGRDSFVIPDPYESGERIPDIGEGVLWYGHQSNLKDLQPYIDTDKLMVLTGEAWSREAQLEALDICACVIVPTGDRKGKSANRLIEAVRNGRFVVAGEMPSHDEFKPYMWIGDINKGLEWFYAHPDEAIERVKACQDYIRHRYSPQTIGKMWFELLTSEELNGHYDIHRTAKRNRELATSL